MVHGLVHAWVAGYPPLPPREMEHGMAQRRLAQHRDAGRAQRGWSIEAVRSLGLTTTVDNAASILNISRTKAYALAKQGDFPIKLVRVGRRYLVSIPAVLALLSVDHPNE
jgi:excisionase family DNA binding protein